jgi:hypothetical protein
MNEIVTKDGTIITAGMYVLLGDISRMRGGATAMNRWSHQVVRVSKVGSNDGTLWIHIEEDDRPGALNWYFYLDAIEEVYGYSPPNDEDVLDCVTNGLSSLFGGEL